MRLVSTLLLLVSSCDAPRIEIAASDAAVDARSEAGPQMDPAILELSRAYCTMAKNCWPFDLGILFGTYETCLARHPSLLVRYFGVGSNFTSEKIRACAAAYPVNDCGRAQRQIFEFQLPEACVVPGRLPVGASCINRYQCDTLRCTSGGAGCGVCVALVNEGAACQNDAICKPGHLCVGDTCSRLREVGEACDVSRVCHVDLACSAGKCAPRPLSGQACVDDPWPCGIGYGPRRCDPLLKKCELPHVAKISEPCGAFPDAFVDCAHGLMCQRAATDDVGKCVPGIADGQVCGWQPWINSGGCISPAVCAGGVCRLPEYDDCNPPGVPP